MEPCPQCRAGKPPVEIAGLRFHAFADRWISCTGVGEEKVIVSAHREFIDRVHSACDYITVRNLIRLHRRFYSGKFLGVPPASH